MWSHFAPVEDKMVVSDTGEQWSPQTAPAMTADKQGNINSTEPGMAWEAMAAAIGNIIPKVPQLVPVENAITDAKINKSAGNKASGNVSETKEAK